MAALGIGWMSQPVHSIQPRAGSNTSAAASAQNAARTLNPAAPSLQSDLRSQPASAQRLETFRRAAGGTWEARWDARGDRPNVVQGSGIPLLPGKGNALKPDAFGVAAADELTLSTAADAARRFLDAQRDLLRLDGIELALDAERSGGYGADKPFWSVEFGQSKNGVRVDGAFVYVRVSHGNVVQFGAERVGGVRIDTTPASTREQAFQAAWQELTLPSGATLASLDEPGELRLVALPADDAAKGVAFNGAWGEGYRHLLVWRYRFRLAGDQGNYEMQVDANTRRLLDLRDLTVTVDARVTGGVYPTTNLEPEVIVPLPFATVNVGGTDSITDTLGLYDYTGGTASVTLDGQYFKIVDNCGPISLSSSSDGNLAFGSGPGTDCATPPGNTAGAGNTHASRTGFYHLSRINEKARGLLPDNGWLRRKLTANMNINDVCNAFYSSPDDTVNFFKSGSGCGNTGEIAAVFLHEWGHGLDNHSGGTADEAGSGEAVGDTFAFLETGQSCLGPGFYTDGGTCHGCTTCTGVRDVGDFADAGPRLVARPSTVVGSGGIDCGAYVGAGDSCPYYASGIFPVAYQGPMGYEGHCESQIAGSANWDLRTALIERFGQDGAAQMDRIWYGSLQPSKSAYQVQAGGQCNPQATVNGCGATNWYTVYLAVDDDDGNLANGTPNACRIWDAFDAHGIACGERPLCSGEAPTFFLKAPNDPQPACALADARVAIEVGSQQGFTDPVTLSASEAPAGTSVSFSPNPVAAGAASAATIAGLNGLGAGIHRVRIDGSAQGSSTDQAWILLDVTPVAPGALALNNPGDGAEGVFPSRVEFRWAAAEHAASYTVEVADDAEFTRIVAGQSGLTTTSWTADSLPPGARYYWRVRAVNTCGSVDSTVFSFATGNPVCQSPSVSFGREGVDSTISIPDEISIRQVQIRIDADAGATLGALKFSLSHAGRTVNLFEDATCRATAMRLMFNDAAAPPLCVTQRPLLGQAAPHDSLNAAFSGVSAAGDWVLRAVGGTTPSKLNRWCVDIGTGTGDAVFTDGFDGRP